MNAQDSALLQSIMETTVDALIVSDDTGTILRANPAAGRMFGYAHAEMIGQSINLLVPHAVGEYRDGRKVPEREPRGKRFAATGRDLEGQRKDRSLFPVHVSIGEVEISGNCLCVAILHDLTLRKATQDALARSQRLDAIGQMTGGIAHDFNNLLTVIIGNLELLEMRGMTDAQLPLIRDALEAAEMGADLTSRLKVFARKSDLKPVQVDLRTLCDETLAILKRAIGAAIQIRTDYAEEVGLVLVDPMQLQSALMNLALNARDAMDNRGDLLISVSNVSIDDSYMAQETDIEYGDYVRLSVSDNGQGMSEEAQRRAFEPFFTTKSDIGGTGLGLAMVYGFVRQSGGHITLYSELGHGSSFGLYFPVIAQAGDFVQHTHAQGNQVQLPQGNGERIMIVEDNPKVRKLSVQRIRDLGYRTLEASSGDAAYALLKRGIEVDLVFSDLVMPGSLSGYDLAAKIASEFPQIKVLLTSGYASDVVTDAMSHDTGYDILHKPYRHAELSQRVQALLSGSVSEGRT